MIRTTRWFANIPKSSPPFARLFVFQYPLLNIWIPKICTNQCVPS